MQNVIELLKSRGLIEAITHDELTHLVETPQKIYCGFDPTSDSLHLGNLVPIIVLAWFQRCGHTPYAIVGGATGMVGDPSGKIHERPLLDEETVARNLKGIQKNLETVLCFDGSLPMPVILNNYDWFQEFNVLTFLRDVGKQFRMGPMLAKDAVRTRLESEEGMSFSEFSYQLLQGYDFYHLYTEHGITIQSGGSDQWGNITAGIDITRRLASATVYGVTFPLLTRSDGKKFGKSEKGAIWLSPEKLSSYEFYQYLYRIPDADVTRLMRMLTFMDMEEILQIEAQMTSSDYVPNTAQKRLAEEVTRMIHGEEGLVTALKVTRGASPGMETKLDRETLEAIAKDMPSYSARSEKIIGAKLVDVVAELGIRSSKGEVRRLIKNGGVYLNNKKMTEEDHVITQEDLIDQQLLLLALGKKNKILIRVETDDFHG
ncbi:MAG: Tyrosine--tRNA ligase [Chlamydiae bacterium]|nr:Tyrosine--tRNA ligase [Chlamydiota bacterium]